MSFSAGETDWKIITIDVNDPVADQVNGECRLCRKLLNGEETRESKKFYVTCADISDIEKHFPGLMKATVEWFKIYKIPDGKPENQFAFNGEPKPADFAQKIVTEVHHYWKRLIAKEVDGKNISW